MNLIWSIGKKGLLYNTKKFKNKNSSVGSIILKLKIILEQYFVYEDSKNPKQLLKFAALFVAKHDMNHS
jgi:hypothetical protein